MVPNQAADLPTSLNPLDALKKQLLENLNDPFNTLPALQPGILPKLCNVNSLKLQSITRGLGH